MGLTVYGGGGKPEEEKTVTAGTSAIVALPSSGKVMKKVTVNPTPTETKEVSPTATDQTYNPPEGKHFSQFTVKAMEEGALSDITVSSAGLITAQVGTEGYIAAGTKKTKQLTKQVAKTWMPTTADQSIPSGVYTTGKQTIKGDSNLVAANIKKDVTLFGVAGSLEEITIKSGKYTPFTEGSSLSVEHGLGKTPTAYGINSISIKETGNYGYTVEGVNVSADDTKILVSIGGSPQYRISGFSWFVAG